MHTNMTGSSTDRPFPAAVVGQPKRQGIVIPELEPEGYTYAEQLGSALANGQAAIEELNLLKPILALALSKLPKKQLHVTLSEHATLGEKFAMQAKADGNGGIILRSVAIL